MTLSDIIIPGRVIMTSQVGGHSYNVINEPIKPVGGGCINIPLYSSLTPGGLISSRSSPLYRQLLSDWWLSVWHSLLLHLCALHHHREVGQGQEALPHSHGTSDHPRPVPGWVRVVLQPSQP